MKIILKFAWISRVYWHVMFVWENVHYVEMHWFPYDLYGSFKSKILLQNMYRSFFSCKFVLKCVPCLEIEVIFIVDIDADAIALPFVLTFQNVFTITICVFECYSEAAAFIRIFYTTTMYLCMEYIYTCMCVCMSSMCLNNRNICCWHRRLFVYWNDKSICKMKR